MRAPSFPFLLILGLLALIALPLPPEAALAEDEPKERAGLWVYDVRVVQVQADPIKGLTPAPWEGSASTVTTPWAEHLAALQARGKVFVMLDQRTSSMDGIQCEASARTTLPLKRFDNETVAGQVRRFDRIDMGVDATFKTGEALEYSVRVNWLHYLPREDAVPSVQTSWKGTHTPLADGQTLALVNRQHVRGRTGESEVAEIHCFITARFTAK